MHHLLLQLNISYFVVRIPDFLRVSSSSLSIRPAFSFVTVANFSSKTSHLVLYISSSSSSSFSNRISRNIATSYESLRSYLGAYLPSDWLIENLVGDDGGVTWTSSSSISPRNLSLLPPSFSCVVILKLTLVNNQILELKTIYNGRRPQNIKRENLNNHYMDCDLWVLRGNLEENSEEISSVAMLSPACLFIYFRWCHIKYTYSLIAYILICINPFISQHINPFISYILIYCTE